MQILFIGYGESDARVTEAREAGHTVEHRPGPLDASEQAELWQGMTLAAPDVVWIRWSALEPPSLSPLRRFRVARPATRIIVDIPDTLEPPDPAIGQLVGMGLYDIVRESRLLAAVLAQHPTYADVVQWQFGAETDQTTDPTAPTLKEREKVVEIIEKRVASTARPAIITVRGMLPGVGTTQLAMAAAWWLAEQGYPVALMEYFTEEQAGKPSDLARLDGAQLPPGLRCIPRSPLTTPASHTLASLLQEHTAAYIVLDCGVSKKAPALPVLPDLEWVVVPPASRWGQTPELLHQSGILPSLSPHDRFVTWALESAPAPPSAIPLHKLPWVWGGWPPGEPVPDALANRLRELLAPVLPDIVPMGWRHRWRRLFGRLRPRNPRLGAWALGITGIGLLALIVDKLSGRHL